MFELNGILPDETVTQTWHVTLKLKYIIIIIIYTIL